MQLQNTPFTTDIFLIKQEISTYKHYLAKAQETDKHMQTKLGTLLLKDALLNRSRAEISAEIPS